MATVNGHHALGEYCTTCGTDTGLCQTCGRVVCGRMLIWVNGTGNVCIDCEEAAADKIDLRGIEIVAKPVDFEGMDPDEAAEMAYEMDYNF